MAATRADYQKQYDLVRGPDGAVLYALAARPALTLPSEVISTIFLFSLPDDEFIAPKPNEAPLSLISICKRWRVIAVNTPAVWASLSIDITWLPAMDDWIHPDEWIDLDEDELEYVYGEDIFLQWISRAKRMPLSIKIPKDSPVYDMDCLLQEIAELAAQWQNVCFFVDPDYVDLLFPVDSKFPMLRKFILDCAEGIYPPPTLEDATMLREICISGAATPISVARCIGIIEEGINLVDCSFFLTPDQPIALLPRVANLQHLALHEQAQTGAPLLAMSVLRNLTLPALKNLALKFVNPGRRPPVDITEFISFASRSSLQLESLTLCLMPVSEVDLLSCLAHVPSVFTLRLQLPASMTTFLERLASDGHFLPRLRFLYLVNFSSSQHNTPCTYKSPRPNSMLTMLDSRCRGPVNSRACLQLVHFRHAGTQAMNHFTTVVKSDPVHQALEKEGIDFVYERLPRALRHKDWWLD
ncbi:hypothetical protein FB45DRAFT_925825 [Roridomyces roridus]|uniref:F-box domain-containing protein n=1 Tax=Roridomyces roridus TaxID=1738132 RepID=A0AAD7BK13_9AGAR|nr:hypothetical protein FB45DRAFT_925825 [Roridomyces roridus]